MEATSLEHLILNIGVVQKFQSQFSRVNNSNLPLQVHWIQSTDIYKHLTEIQKQTNKPLRFPYLFLKLTNVTFLDSSSGKSLLARNTAKFGSFGSLNSSQNMYNVHTIIPADFEVEATFITDSYQDLMRYIKRWSFTAVQKKLNFTANYDDIPTTVTVDMNDSLSIPQKENDVENADTYTVESSLVVHGWLSDDENRKGVQTIYDSNMRPVDFDANNFNSLDEQVASDLAGETQPNYVPIPDTTPQQYEEWPVNVEDQ